MKSSYRLISVFFILFFFFQQHKGIYQTSHSSLCYNTPFTHLEEKKLDVRWANVPFKVK